MRKWKYACATVVFLWGRIRDEMRMWKMLPPWNPGIYDKHEAGQRNRKDGRAARIQEVKRTEIKAQRRLRVARRER